MSSIYKKPTSMSNWFSSLRRPQKSKKQQQTSSSFDNIINDNDNNNDDYINNKKKLQKSCIDLTSNSIFYTDFPISYQFHDNNTNISDDNTIINNNNNNNKINDIIIDNSDKKLLLNNQNVQQLCSKCYYQIDNNHIQKSSNSSINSPINSKYNSPINTPLNTPLLLQKKLPLICNNDTMFITNQYENSEFKIETDKTTDIQITKIPKFNSNGNKLLYNKRSEFKTTTTTMITRTTVLINHDIDNDNDISEKFHKFRTNSLGSILDCDNIGRPILQYHKNNNINLKQQLPNNYNLIKPNSPLLGDNNDFLFIDENSNSNGNDCNNNNNDNSQNLDQINNNNNNNCDSDTNSLNNSEQNVCLACKCPIQQKDKFNIESESLLPQTIEKFADKFKSNFDNTKKSVGSKKQIKDELCEVVSEMETLDSQEDSKHSNKDKQMSIGRKKFNMDPKKGIEYLVDNRLLQTEPQDIANFLYKGEGLNKTAIGDYLGEKNDFNEKVLKAFVELHDFTNLILVQALRQFLWSFRLPGEAQKIDRMMECFAQRYCQLNPDIFTNTDTCYVLSFAIIMLNTSLHNPSVKDKPSVEQFITMNRGINNGGDLPRGLLESLYESIRTEPFKIPQDDGNDLMHTFFNPDKEGWLWKQGGRYKSWKRRWFILNDNCLYYFEYTTDKEPRGIIPLENISVREIQDRNKPHCFELYACGGADIIKACKTDSEGKVVEGKHTVYRMSAATEEDKLEWIKRLTQSISHNPFYDILVQRKKKALAKS